MERMVGHAVGDVGQGEGQWKNSFLAFCALALEMENLFSVFIFTDCQMLSNPF
jgi:hypothetical protein